MRGGRFVIRSWITRLMRPVGMAVPARRKTPSAASSMSSARRPVLAETNSRGGSGRKKSSRRTAARNFARNSSSSSKPSMFSSRKACFARSHLLTTMTRPQPSRASSPASCLSMRVTPCPASSTRKTTSVSARISSARVWEKKSSVSRLLAVRRPAVSTRTKEALEPSALARERRERTGSRVVPAISLTIRREPPSRRLPSELFPTLGRPARARRMARGPSSRPGSGAGPRTDWIRATSAGIPRPCSAEVSIGSPNPRAKNSP